MKACRLIFTQKLTCQITAHFLRQYTVLNVLLQNLVPFYKEILLLHMS